MGEKECNEVKYAWELSEKEEVEAFCWSYSILNGAILFPIMQAVLDLGVLRIISQRGPQGRMSASEIASRLPTSNPEAAAMLGRMLDFLAAYSILTVDVTTHPGGTIQRLYGLTPLCKFLLPNQEGVSMAGFCTRMNFDTVTNSAWELKEVVVEGGLAFRKAHGMSYYEYQHSKDGEDKEGFDKIMSHHSSLVISKLLTIYKGFENISTLVDVGGGIGVTLNMIRSKYPHIKAINFDQPHIVATAPSYPGVEHVGGDLLDNIPKGDAIFLKWICHGYDDETCIKILKKCYNALPKDNGKVILCECLAPEATETSNGNIVSNSVRHLDMIMMLLFGGKERTKLEFQALAFSAGFQSFQLVCSAYNIHLMELYKV